jgi:hypothetical protein
MGSACYSCWNGAEKLARHICVAVRAKHLDGMLRLLRCALCLLSVLAPPLTAAWSPCTRARIEFADRSSAAVCAAYFSTQHMFPPPQSLRVRVADLPATYPSLCKPRKLKKRRMCTQWIRRVLRAWQ